ncbi:MAG TPA: ATP-binding protein [Aquihabitans sp.]|jgi:anti-sigma regulatory factor (Ser/Thr protein kinase)|nr:ATP-binding protein [Aquihabitans sp.]
MTTSPPSDRAPSDVRSARFPSNDRLPAAARDFVRGAVDALGTSTPEDALLMTSEAASNAVEHADSSCIEVVVERHGPVVRISISDDDPEQPVMLPQDPQRVGGLGIRLIDHLAVDWGVTEIAGDGKRVWFDVELPSS